MNFLTYGDKSKPAILFIHGMASTALLCYEPILRYFEDYYVVLAEVDGHSDQCDELLDLSDNCSEIEKYVADNLHGRLFCLSGFSMGGTMAVEIAGRGKIDISKLHLDAAFLTKMGILTKPYEFVFCKAIAWMIKGKKIPRFLMDSFMGKDNRSVAEMLYTGVTPGSIKSACEFIYKYDMPENMRKFKGDTVFWYGENEAYPKKSAVLLKKYLPDMKIKVFPGMGHGQYLHEHSKEYAMELNAFLRA